jgi:TolB-like protein/lipoprotein NlpI
MNQKSARTSFLAELKRRHVIRVALAYAGVGFIVAQLADVVLPALGLAWAVTLVVVLLLLGFPIAVVLAWAFDITPQGLQRTPDAPATLPHPPAPEPPDGARAETFVSPSRHRELPDGSIGALPFVNLSGDTAHEYFGDGLTDELIATLSRVPGLRVAARTSCFALKKAALDAREAGERLGVRHIVEGSVRISGKVVRLSVQLVDVQTGYAVWSEVYDRQLDDIIAIQREIARAIVERVAIADPAGARSRIERTTTRNVEALQLYLQGRYCCNRRTEGDLRRAVGFFERAVRLDPDYALAYAGLADTYAILLDYGFLSSGEALEQARVAAERALQLDPAAGENYTSLALVRQFEWRWQEAEDAFRTSIRLAPDYPVSHQRFALHLAWLGRTDEGLEEARCAEALDPLSFAASATVGWVLYYARRFDEAVTQLTSTLEKDAQFATARIALSRSLLERGESDRGIAEMERALADSGRAASVLALLAHAYGEADRRGDARRAAQELQDRAQNGYVSSYYLALPQLGLGERARALDLLESALHERVAQLVYLRAEPIMDPLRQERRFQSILQTLAFP